MYASNSNDFTYCNKFKDYKQYGIIYEPVALELMERTNSKIYPCKNETFEGFGTRPDGIMFKDGKKYVIEIKCVTDEFYIDLDNPKHTQQIQIYGQREKANGAILVKCLFKEGRMYKHRWHGYWKTKDRKEFVLGNSTSPLKKPPGRIGFTCTRFFPKEFQINQMMTIQPRMTGDDLKIKVWEECKIDKELFDIFWAPIKKDDLILLNDQMIRYLGFSDEKLYNARTSIKRCLKKINWNPAQCKNAVRENFEDNGRQRGQSIIKIPLVTKREFKKLCMKLKSDRGEQIMEYFLDMEEVLQKIMTQQLMLDDR